MGFVIVYFFSSSFCRSSKRSASELTSSIIGYFGDGGGTIGVDRFKAISLSV